MNARRQPDKPRFARSSPSRNKHARSKREPTRLARRFSGRKLPCGSRLAKKRLVKTHFVKRLHVRRLCDASSRLKRRNGAGAHAKIPLGRRLHAQRLHAQRLHA
jgi:hypothetical protein